MNGASELLTPAAIWDQASALYGLYQSSYEQLGEQIKSCTEERERIKTHYLEPLEAEFRLQQESYHRVSSIVAKGAAPAAPAPPQAASEEAALSPPEIIDLPDPPEPVVIDLNEDDEDDEDDYEVNDSSTFSSSPSSSPLPMVNRRKRSREEESDRRFEQFTKFVSDFMSCRTVLDIVPQHKEFIQRLMNFLPCPGQDFRATWEKIARICMDDPSSPIMQTISKPVKNICYLCSRSYTDLTETAKFPAGCSMPQIIYMDNDCANQLFRVTGAFHLIAHVKDERLDQLDLASRYEIIMTALKGINGRGD